MADKKLEENFAKGIEDRLTKIRERVIEFGKHEVAELIGDITEVVHEIFTGKKPKKVGQPEVIDVEPTKPAS